MTYSGNSDPRGYRPLDAAWRPAIAAHNPGEADAICDAYEEGCRAIGYDANLAIAQGCVECTFFTSQRWRNAHAAAGVGIYGDGTPDVIWGGGPHGDARTGVLSQCELLSDYFCGGAEPWDILAAHGFGGMNLGKTNLSGMDGVWAVPGDGYGAHIAAIANQVIGGGNVADTGVYGEDLIAIMAKHEGEAVSDGTLDAWNAPHPWEGWCQASVEGVRAAAGLAVTHRPSAAAQLDAVIAQGLLQQGRPEHGGIVMFGRAFDPSGHTCLYDEDRNQFLSTLYGPSRIGYYHSDAWYGAMAGWWRAPGVVAARRTAQPAPPPPAPQPVADSWTIDGNPYGPVPLRMPFFGRWDALNTMGTKLDHPGAVNPQGLALPTLGYPMEPETTLPTGRRVVRFERGWLATDAGNDPFDCVVLMLSERPQ